MFFSQNHLIDSSLAIHSAGYCFGHISPTRVSSNSLYFILIFIYDNCFFMNIWQAVCGITHGTVISGVAILYLDNFGHVWSYPVRCIPPVASPRAVRSPWTALEHF